MMSSHAIWRTLFSLTAVLLLAAAGTTLTAYSQVMIGDTFYVTGQTKTPAHPWYGKESKWGLAINGVEGGTIRLQREVRYTFISVGLPNDYYSFMFMQDSVGKYENTVGVTPRNILYGYDTIYFQPLKNFGGLRTRDTLYYHSPGQYYSGGMILVYDQIPSGVDDDVREAPDRPVSHHGVEAYPNPASNATTLFFTLSERSEVKLELVNTQGEVVISHSAMYEQAGTHEMHLPLRNVIAGPYFYRLSYFTDDRVETLHGVLQVLR